MTSRTIFLSLACLSLSIYGPYSDILSADQEAFPFLAEVTGDHVNVRAGQSANFERVYQLAKGEEVVVVDKEYSWYKIQLPPSAKSYVSKKYVQFLGQNAGGILADRVNIRAGAGIHHTSLGQLTVGEQIYIREELDEWYRIQPAAKSYGWVSDQFLAFKSKDVVEYQTMLNSKPSIKEGLQELVEEHSLEEETVEEMISKEDEGILSVVGFVEPYEDKGTDGIYYKLIVDGQPACYIQGLNHMLGRFMHHRVTVEGTVNQKLRSQYAYPVIIVSKVKLML